MKFKAGAVVWFGVTLLISVTIVIIVNQNWLKANEIIVSLGLLGPVISILLYALFALTPLTTDPISVVNVIAFGPAGGTLVTVLGNSVAAIVEYFFGRHLDSATNANDYLAKLPGVLSQLPVNSVWFLVGGRLVPGYGTKIVSILAGLKKVPMAKYAWTTLVTNIFGAIFITTGALGLLSLF